MPGVGGVEVGKNLWQPRLSKVIGQRIDHDYRVDSIYLGRIAFAWRSILDIIRFEPSWPQQVPIDSMTAQDCVYSFCQSPASGQDQNPGLI
jgi:hypothetical protein